MLGLAKTGPRKRLRLTRFFWDNWNRLMYYVYVLQSETDHGLYIGFSADLRRRIAEHRQGLAFATSFRGPWRLIYYEAYVEEEDALGRERFLKSGGGRRFLKKQLKHYFTKWPTRERAA